MIEIVEKIPSDVKTLSEVKVSLSNQYSFLSPAGYAGIILVNIDIQTGKPIYILYPIGNTYLGSEYSQLKDAIANLLSSGCRVFEHETTDSLRAWIKDNI